MLNRKNTNGNVPLKVALFTSLGSGLEYYDFVIYGMMAKYLSDIFFSVNDSFCRRLFNETVWSENSRTK